ncbi:MAG: hypothetical protein ACPGF7_05950 [Pontibacterium sp.]
METVAHKSSPVMLSFVQEQNNERENWSVNTSGDYDTDFSVGRAYARELLSQVRANVVSPFFTAVVLSAMPLDKGPVENGFIAELTSVAAQVTF